MTARRERWEIASDILKAAMTPKAPTRIMHNANMSSENFEKHVSALLEKGCLEYIPNPNPNNKRTPRLLRTTEKGEDFLMKLNDLGK